MVTNHKQAGDSPQRPRYARLFQDHSTLEHNEQQQLSRSSLTFDEAKLHHAIVDLPPISPRACAPRATIFHHHSPPIRHQVRGSQPLHRVSRAKDREPAARRAAPGAKQEGNLVQESAAEE
jgi:hypothetical protein